MSTLQRLAKCHKCGIVYEQKKNTLQSLQESSELSSLFVDTLPQWAAPPPLM